MKIFLASDHRGFEQKQIVFDWLKEAGHQAVDMGNDHFDPDDDFTDFVGLAAQEVARDKNSLGIVFCGSGAGANIMANKTASIRATLAWTPSQVEAAKADDDINVLAMATDFLEIDTTIKLIEVFLETKFKGEERHLRRLGKIVALEKA